MVRTWSDWSSCTCDGESRFQFRIGVPDVGTSLPSTQSCVRLLVGLEPAGFEAAFADVLFLDQEPVLDLALDLVLGPVRRDQDVIDVTRRVLPVFDRRGAVFFRTAFEHDPRRFGLGNLKLLVP
jgi:hypothetical protein